jgi:hypothetical protein
MGYADMDRPDLVGIGGWLKFFVFSMLVLSPLTVTARLAISLYGDPRVAAFYGERWIVAQVTEWSIIALSVGICWYVGYRLLRVRTRQTVRLAIAGIWTLGIPVILLEGVLIALIADRSVGDLVASLAPEFIRPTIFAVIWTGYFLRSQRVANTYADRTEDELSRVFA